VPAEFVVFVALFSFSAGATVCAKVSASASPPVGRCLSARFCMAPLLSITNRLLRLM
jgi:hypothetical protein